MAATALDYLAIRGLPTEGDEAFVGIGPTTSNPPGDITVTVQQQQQDERTPTPPPKSDISEDTDIGEALWKAQNTMLKRQNDYLDKLSKELATKWEDVPDKLTDRTVKESMIETLLKWLAGKVAEHFWGELGKDIAELSVTLIAGAIRVLRALYSEGEALCKAMIAENTALLSLEQSRENFELRSMFVTQHDRSIQNLQGKIDDAERHVYNSLEIKEINETLKMIQAEDNIVECPISGHCIYTKSLVVDHKKE